MMSKKDAQYSPAYRLFHTRVLLEQLNSKENPWVELLLNEFQKKQAENNKDNTWSEFSAIWNNFKSNQQTNSQQ